MTRNVSGRKNEKRAKVRRAYALERNDFRYPSEARAPAQGATSFPLKAEDPETKNLIAKFMEKRT